MNRWPYVNCPFVLPSCCADCWASNNVELAQSIGPSSNGCNYTCSGNTSEICGGWWINSVYVVSGGCPANTPPSPPPPPPPPCNTPVISQYVGCFWDNPSRLIPHLIGGNTIESCAYNAHTQGYTVIGLQAGGCKSSQCGHSIPSPTVSFI